MCWPGVPRRASTSPSSTAVKAGFKPPRVIASGRVSPQGPAVLAAAPLPTDPPVLAKPTGNVAAAPVNAVAHHLNDDSAAISPSVLL